MFPSPSLLSGHVSQTDIGNIYFVFVVRAMSSIGRWFGRWWVDEGTTLISATDSSVVWHLVCFRESHSL